MKYKNIDNSLHNFGQSFTSLMNYFDNDYVMDDINRLMNENNLSETIINFSNGTTSLENAINKRIKSSIKHYSEHLSKHLLSHDIEPNTLKNVTLTYKRTPKGWQSFMSTKDDKGASHEVYVNPA